MAFGLFSVLLRDHIMHQGCFLSSLSLHRLYWTENWSTNCQHVWLNKWLSTARLPGLLTDGNANWSSVIVRLVALLLHILKILVSNLYPEIGCIIWIFSWLSSVFRDVNHLPSTSFVFVIHESSCISFYAKYSHILEVSLNKPQIHKHTGWRNKKTLMT
jgi:hypothetical protein